MAEVKEYLQDLLNARYGKDVRQAIHDSIQAINEQVEKCGTGTNTENSSDTIPQLASNVYMGSQTTLDALKAKIDEEVVRCKKAGIRRIVPNPRVAYSSTKGFYFGVDDFEYSITDVLDYVKNTYTDVKADAIKISTKIVKELFVDGVVTDKIRQQYITFISVVAVQLKPYGLEYFTIANESHEMYASADNEQMMLDCIRAVQAQGIQCGITTEGMVDVAGTMESILQACDVVAVNLYPLVSFRGSQTTYQDCVNGWKTLGFAEWVQSFVNDYGKKVMISETGIRDYMEFFTHEYDLDAEVADLMHTDSLALAMWLHGLFELIKNGKVPLYRVQLWYLDNIPLSSNMGYLADVISKDKEVKQ